MRRTFSSMAADGMVLVRNTGVLPLDPAAAPTIALVGEHARIARTQGGGSATVFPDHVVTPFDGLVAAYGAERVRYAAGVKSSESVLPIDGRVATDPVTGEPGVHVRFLAEDGAVLLDEHRASGKLVWLGDPILADTAVVEATAEFTAPEAGEYSVGFAGLGLFRFPARTPRWNGLSASVSGSNASPPRLRWCHGTGWPT